MLSYIAHAIWQQLDGADLWLQGIEAIPMLEQLGLPFRWTALPIAAWELCC